MFGEINDSGMQQPYVQHLFSSKTFWLDEISFPCSLTSCHSNDLETQLWASLRAPGELSIYLTHTSTRICAGQHTKTYFEESAERKMHSHVHRNQLQSDSTFTCTHRRMRITDPRTNTHTIQSTPWQADRQMGSCCDRCSFFNPH